MLAIAVKELLEAFKTLGRGGFAFPHRDRELLSTAIRDLLSQCPNIPRVEATLKQVESLGTRPSADYFVAKSLLARVRKSLDRNRREPSSSPPAPSGSVATRSLLPADTRSYRGRLLRREQRAGSSFGRPLGISRPENGPAIRAEKIRIRDDA